MRRTILLAVGLMLCFSLPAFSQSVLILDKDHNKTFVDPEGAGFVDATYGVKKALDECGYTYKVMYSFPSDLGPYDIIFLVMGTYC